MARATNSLPVPDSPVISTVTSEERILCTSSTRRVIAALAVRSHGPANVLFVLLSARVLLLEAAAAAWRLHRRQGVALTITRSLLDLNAADRVELERHLRTRYRRREARIEERNAARLERLAGEIDALQTEVLGRSHRRVAM